MCDYFLIGCVFESSHINGAFQFWPGRSRQMLFHLLDLIPQGSLAVSWCLDQTPICAILFGGRLGLRFDKFLAKYCEDVLQNLPVCRIDVTESL